MAFICFLMFCSLSISIWPATSTASTTAGDGNSFPAAFKKNDRLHVLALEGVELKEEPDFNARTMIPIRYGRVVEVASVSGVRATRGWLKGHWICARFGNFEGYIFDGYLSTLPAPALKASEKKARSREYSRHYNRENMGIAGLLNAYIGDYIDADFRWMQAKGEAAIPPPDCLQATSRIEQQLGNGFKVIYRCGGGNSWLELKMKGVRIMDVFHLTAALLRSDRYRKRILKDLVFVKNKEGQIYRITGKRKKWISIRRTRNNEIRLCFRCPFNTVALNLIN